jgi:hypothetical protein
MNDAPTVQISREAFSALVRLTTELEEVLETIDCLNDTGLMASIRRAEADVEAGRTTRIETPSDLDRLWADDDR